MCVCACVLGMYVRASVYRPQVCGVCAYVCGLGPLALTPAFHPRGRGAGLVGEPHVRSPCRTVSPPSPPTSPGVWNVTFVVLIFPPPVLGSSQRDIWGGWGWSGGWEVSSFLCVYVIYLTVLPLPHWPFPVPHICTVQAIKTRFRPGPPPGPCLAYGVAPSARCLPLPLLLGPFKLWRQRRRPGGRWCQAQAGEGGDCWEWELLSLGNSGPVVGCGGQRSPQVLRNCLGKKMG